MEVRLTSELERLVCIFGSCDTILTLFRKMKKKLQLELFVFFPCKISQIVPGGIWDLESSYPGFPILLYRSF